MIADCAKNAPKRAGIWGIQLPLEPKPKRIATPWSFSRDRTHRIHNEIPVINPFFSALACAFLSRTRCLVMSIGGARSAASTSQVAEQLGLKSSMTPKSPPPATAEAGALFFGREERQASARASRALPPPNRDELCKRQRQASNAQIQRSLSSCHLTGPGAPRMWLALLSHADDCRLRLRTRFFVSIPRRSAGGGIEPPTEIFSPLLCQLSYQPKRRNDAHRKGKASVCAGYRLTR